MGLVLHIDKVAWHGQIDALASERPGLIPVVKANGYGFGTARLAAVAQAHGFAHLAVGTLAEAIGAAPHFAGDLTVLTPWDPRVDEPRIASPDLASRTVRTVSSLVAAERLGDLAGTRIVVELASPMMRFGLMPEQFAATAHLIDRPIDALTVHLPLATHTGEDVAPTVIAALEAGLEAPEVQISHLPVLAGARLAAETGLRVRHRIGSSLWLGSGTALSATGTVRAVHAVSRRDRIGYRRALVPGPGHILVVDGGTAHGVGLRAVAAGMGARRRLRTLARDSVEASGFVYSPFSLDGHRLRFADTPHAQVSMLWLRDGMRVPAVGEDLALTVRHTITHADQVIEH
ncbi:MAG: alanine racemase [Bifidobacteriaceae bacterium]|jgi:hypothetical protein|nr:alanine racemase [Bifidobacteriaceae bacterium]